MRLIDALRFTRNSCIAFVGAGGKTTAMLRLAREILSTQTDESMPNAILITTSTHFGDWQARQSDHHYIVTSLKELQKLREEVPGGVVLVTGEESGHRLGGLSPILLDELQHIADIRGLSLLIEADGAQLHALKAPAEHEPVIPDFIHHVVVVAGLSALGKPLTEEWVHRVDQFAALSGLKPKDEITADGLCAVLLAKHGGLQHVPCGARRSVLLNQVDNEKLESQALQMCKQLIPTYNAGIIASLSPDNRGVSRKGSQELDARGRILATVEPIGGIILAAGGSNRFGEPKQLLPWKGQPVIRYTVLAAVQAGLSPVNVVLGSSADEVREVIKDLPVRIVINSQWINGVSSSIKAGMGALPENLGAVVFLQGDQPQIPPKLITDLIEAHQHSLHPIIAPLIDGRRGNPVLFDSCTFPRLLMLDGEAGGRGLFNHYPVDYVTWPDSNLLLDIDTPEDYELFLKMYPQDVVPS